MSVQTNGHVDAIGAVSNDAEFVVSASMPYVASVTIEGTAAILWHRWSCESVEAKSKAAKNSAAKKTDDIESYVYRDENGNISIPGSYIKGSICDPQHGAAKFRQDPRSPRKSALDLYRAGLVPLTALAPVTNAKGEVATQWDYLDQRRVVVQRSGITRIRPAFLAGWRASFELQVLTPEYISPADLLDVLTNAGRLVGIGDFRPTYGRFQIVQFEVLA